MPNPHTAEHQDQCRPANAHTSVALTRADLPLHCPQSGTALWASHPRVFIPIEDAPDKRMICPYCGTEYILRD
jgi:uncharacterized Zn-finger protein